MRKFNPNFMIGSSGISGTTKYSTSTGNDYLDKSNAIRNVYASENLEYENAIENDAAKKGYTDVIDAITTQNNLDEKYAEYDKKLAAYNKQKEVEEKAKIDKANKSKDVEESTGWWQDWLAETATQPATSQYSWQPPSVKQYESQKKAKAIVKDMISSTWIGHLTSKLGAVDGNIYTNKEIADWLRDGNLSDRQISDYKKLLPKVKYNSSYTPAEYGNMALSPNPTIEIDLSALTDSEKALYEKVKSHSEQIRSITGEDITSDKFKTTKADVINKLDIDINDLKKQKESVENEIKFARRPSFEYQKKAREIDLTPDGMRDFGDILMYKFPELVGSSSPSVPLLLANTALATLGGTAASAISTGFGAGYGTAAMFMVGAGLVGTQLASRSQESFANTADGVRSKFELNLYNNGLSLEDVIKQNSTLQQIYNEKGKDAAIDHLILESYTKDPRIKDAIEKSVQGANSVYKRNNALGVIDLLETSIALIPGGQMGKSFLKTGSKLLAKEAIHGAENLATKTIAKGMEATMEMSPAIKNLSTALLDELYYAGKNLKTVAKLTQKGLNKVGKVLDVPYLGASLKYAGKIGTVAALEGAEEGSQELIKRDMLEGKYDKDKLGSQSWFTANGMFDSNVISESWDSYMNGAKALGLFTGVIKDPILSNDFELNQNVWGGILIGGGMTIGGSIMNKPMEMYGKHKKTKEDVSKETFANMIGTLLGDKSSFIKTLLLTDRDLIRDPKRINKLFEDYKKNPPKDTDGNELVTREELEKEHSNVLAYSDLINNKAVRKAVESHTDDKTEQALLYSLIHEYNKQKESFSLISAVKKIAHSKTSNDLKAKVTDLVNKSKDADKINLDNVLNHIESILSEPIINESLDLQNNMETEGAENTKRNKRIEVLNKIAKENAKKNSFAKLTDEEKKIAQSILDDGNMSSALSDMYKDKIVTDTMIESIESLISDLTSSKKEHKNTKNIFIETVKKSLNAEEEGIVDKSAKEYNEVKQKAKLEARAKVKADKKNKQLQKQLADDEKHRYEDYVHETMFGKNEDIADKYKIIEHKGDIDENGKVKPTYYNIARIEDGRIVGNDWSTNPNEIQRKVDSLNQSNRLDELEKVRKQKDVDSEVANIEEQSVPEVIEQPEVKTENVKPKDTVSKKKNKKETKQKEVKQEEPKEKTSSPESIIDLFLEGKTIKDLTPSQKIVYGNNKEYIDDEVLRRKPIEKRSVEPITIKTLLPQFQGKIIYATPGSGKTKLAGECSFIIDGDDVIVALIKSEFGVICDNKSLPETLLNLFKSNDSQTMSDFYDKVFESFKMHAKNGQTVLTGSRTFLETKYVLSYYIIDNDDTHMSNKGFTENGINNIRGSEISHQLGSANILEIPDGKYIDSVLTEEGSNTPPNIVPTFVEPISSNSETLSSENGQIVPEVKESAANVPQNASNDIETKKADIERIRAQRLSNIYKTTYRNSIGSDIGKFKSDSNDTDFMRNEDLPKWIQELGTTRSYEFISSFWGKTKEEVIDKINEFFEKELAYLESSYINQEVIQQNAPQTTLSIEPIIDEEPKTEEQITKNNIKNLASTLKGLADELGKAGKELGFAAPNYGEIQAKFLHVAQQLLGEYIKLGIIKFKDYVKNAFNDTGITEEYEHADEFFMQLKGAYGAYSYIHPEVQLDDKQTVDEHTFQELLSDIEDDNIIDEEIDDISEEELDERKELVETSDDITAPAQVKKLLESGMDPYSNMFAFKYNATTPMKGMENILNRGEVSKSPAELSKVITNDDFFSTATFEYKVFWMENVRTKTEKNASVILVIRYKGDVYTAAMYNPNDKFKTMLNDKGYTLEQKVQIITRLQSNRSNIIRAILENPNKTVRPAIIKSVKGSVSTQNTFRKLADIIGLKLFGRKEDGTVNYLSVSKDFRIGIANRKLEIEGADGRILVHGEYSLPGKKVLVSATNKHRHIDLENKRIGNNKLFEELSNIIVDALNNSTLNTQFSYKGVDYDFTTKELLQFVINVANKEKDSGLLFDDIGVTINEKYFTKSELSDINSHSRLEFNEELSKQVYNVKADVIYTDLCNFPLIAKIKDQILRDHDDNILKSLENIIRLDVEDLGLVKYEGSIQKTKEKVVRYKEDDSNKNGISGFGWYAKRGILTSNITDDVQNPPYINIDGIVTDDVEEKPSTGATPIVKTNTEHTSPIQNDIENALGLGAMRKVSTTAYTVYDSKEIEEVKQMLGLTDSDIDILDTMVMAARYGQDVFGVMTKDAIVLSSMMEQGTAYHEAFHRVSLLLIQPYRRMKIYEQYRKDNNLSEGVTDKEIEEMLAEDFRMYMLGRKDIAKTSNIKAFFNKLFKFISNILKLNHYDKMQLFEEISNGLYSTKKIDKDALELFKKEYEQGPFMKFNGKDLKTVSNQKEIRSVMKSFEFLLMNSGALSVSNDIESLIENPEKIDFNRLHAELKFRSTSEYYTESVRKVYAEFADSKIFKEIVIPEMLTSLKNMAISIKNVNYDEDNVELNENGSNEKSYDKDPSTINPVHTLSAEIKIVLNSLPETFVDDNGNLSVKINPLTQSPYTVDFLTAYNKTMGLLNDVMTADEIFERLDAVADKDPFFKVLKNRIEQRMYTNLYDTLSENDKAVVDRMRSENQEADALKKQRPHSIEKIREYMNKKGSIEVKENFLTKMFIGLKKFNSEYIQTNIRKIGKSYKMFISKPGIIYDANEKQKEWNSNFSKNILTDVTISDNETNKEISIIVGKKDVIESVITEYYKLRGYIQKLDTDGYSNSNLLSTKISLIKLLNSIGVTDLTIEMIDNTLSSIYKNKGMNDFEMLKSFILDTSIKVEDKSVYLLNALLSNTHGSFVQLSDPETAFKTKSGSIDPNKYLDRTNVFKELAYQYALNTPSSKKSAFGPNGNSYFKFTQNRAITDAIDAINVNFNGIRDRMKTVKFITGNDANSKGSLYFNQLEKNKNLKLRWVPQINFKRIGGNDGGKDFFQLSPAEDYLMKLLYADSDYMICPTLADKKSWGVMSGMSLFHNVTKYSFSKDGELIVKVNNDVLKQYNSYFAAELSSIKNYLDVYFMKEDENGNLIPKTEQELSESQIDFAFTKENAFKFRNFNLTINPNITKVITITKENGSTIDIEIDKEITLNQLISNYVGDTKGADRYNRYVEIIDAIDSEFYVGIVDNENKVVSKEQRKVGNTFILANAIETQFYNSLIDELYTARRIGIIDFEVKDGKIDFESVTNKKLPENLLKRSARPTNYDEFGNTDHYDTIATIMDFTVNHITSVIEFQKLITKDPAFYKDRDDEIKRFSGLNSTGDNGRTDFPSNHWLSQEGNLKYIGNEPVYNVVEMADIKTSATKETLDILESKFKQNYLRDFRKNLKKENDETDEQFIERVDKEATRSAKIQANVYAGNINMTDAAVYITPKMAKKLIMMFEAGWTKEVADAFDYLENNDWLVNTDKYQKMMKVVLKPLKYVYVGNEIKNGIDMPIYNKMAIFPIFKAIASTGHMKSILESMETNDIDMIKFQSATKVGGTKKTNPYENNYTFEGLIDFSTIPSTRIRQEYFKFLRKQLVTDPHDVDRTFTGTQVIKAALANILPSNIYNNTIVNGKNPSGNDIIIEIMQSINALSDNGVNNIIEEFGITKDQNGNYVLDENVLGEKLYESAKSRNIPYDQLKMFETENGKFKHDLRLLSNTRLIEQVLISIIKKQACDITLPGNSFIQMPSFAMITPNNDEKIKVISDNGNYSLNEGERLEFDKNGATECIISISLLNHLLPKHLKKASFAKKVEYLKSKNIIGNNADPIGIGYRIPTQGQSSIDALIIKDVMPETVGDVIVLPPEFTKKNGSDFDIDKLFMFRYNYKQVYTGNNVELSEDELNIVKQRYTDWFNTIEDGNLAINGERYPDKFVRKSTFARKQKGLYYDKSIDKFYRKEKDIVKHEFDDNIEVPIGSNKWIENLKTNGKESVENRLIQMYIALITSDNHTTETRGSIDTITEKVKNTDGTSILERILKAEGKTVSKSTFNELTPTYHLNKKNENSISKNGIGPFALNAVHHALTQIYKISINNKIANSLGLHDISSIYGRDGERIVDWLSAMINAHVDAAKDPYITLLNVVPLTYGITNLLLRSGLGSTTFYFLKQPIISEYINQNQTEEGYTLSELQNKVKSEYYEKLNKLNNGETEIESIGNDIFNEEFLLSQIAVKPEDRDAQWYYSQIEIIDTFGELSAVVNELSEFVSVSQVDTGKFGNTLTALRMFESRFNKFIGDSMNKKEPIFKPNGVLPFFENSFLRKKLNNTVRFSLDLFSKYLLSGDERFVALEDLLLKMINKEFTKDEKTTDNIYNAISTLMKIKAFNNYLFKSSRFSEDSNTVSDSYFKMTQDFLYGDNNLATRLYNIKNKIQQNKDGKFDFLLKDGAIENTLLNSISYITPLFVENRNNPSYIKFIGNFNTDGNSAEMIINSWSDLLNIASEDQDLIEVKEFANDLALYSFYISADQPDMNNLFKFVPEEKRSEFGMNSMMELDTVSSLIDNFIDIFKNFTHNDSIVPTLYYRKHVVSAIFPNGDKLYEVVKSANGKSTFVDINKDTEKELGVPIIFKASQKLARYDKYDNSIFPPFVKMKVGSRNVLYRLIGTTSTDGILSPIYHYVENKGYSSDQFKFKEITDVNGSSIPTNHLYTYANGKYIKLGEGLEGFIEKNIENESVIISRLREKYGKFFEGISDGNIKIFGNAELFNYYNTKKLDSQVNRSAKVQTTNEEGDNKLTLNNITVDLDKLGINFKLNEQQIAAVSTLFNGVLNDTRLQTLNGYAGTGKSTIIKVLSEFIRKSNLAKTISLTATTNTASVNVENMSDEKSTTIHSLLGIKPSTNVSQIENISKNVFSVDKGYSKLKYGQVVVIDEASMINDDLFEIIEQLANRGKLNIIFLGDNQQLRPASQEHTSKVFTDVETTIDLTDVMRQDKNSELFKVVSGYRSIATLDMSKYEKEFTDSKSMMSATNAARSLLAPRVTSLDGNNRVVFTNNFKQFANNIIELYKKAIETKNYNLIRVVAYTNDRVNSINNGVRKMLGHSNILFNEGELLVSHANVYTNRRMTMSNGRFFTVSGRSDVTYETLYNPIRGGKQIVAPMVTLSLKDTSTGKITKLKIVEPQNQEERSYIENELLEVLSTINREYMQARKIDEQLAFDILEGQKRFKDSFNLGFDIYDSQSDTKLLSKVIDYGYATTVHKAQGQTVEYMFVDERNIDKYSSNPDYLELLYTAVSRASKGLFVATDKSLNTGYPYINENGDYMNDKFGVTEEEDYANTNKFLALVIADIDGLEVAEEPKTYTVEDTTIQPEQSETNISQEELNEINEKHNTSYTMEQFNALSEEEKEIAINCK